MILIKPVPEGLKMNRTGGNSATVMEAHTQMKTTINIQSVFYIFKVTENNPTVNNRNY